MMYIGTSLGGCLRSILDGEVSEDQVLMIITRTRCETYESYVGVVKAYYAEGNQYARNSQMYDISKFHFETVLDLAGKLYNSGRIHQPRLYSGSEYLPIAFAFQELWLEVVPTNTNSSPSVVDAYEKYKMLDSLTR
jgi:hypothetical protein